jgi:hypothetical protein
MRGAVSLIPADIIREYGDIYCDWSDAVKKKFDRFRPNAKLKNLVPKILDRKTALILGAGLSSTTGQFKKYWKKYEDIYDTLTNDPEQVNGFTSLYSYGGIKVVPKFGNGIIPDLVNAGIVPSLLIFNYNCHVEHCLTMCKTGYQSLIYCGENHIEQVIVGTPKCKIFKPHGSARLMEKPTPIIWPNRQPESNFTICKEFVKDIIRRKVKQILILGWSGNGDSYVRKYLEDLKKSDVYIIQIGLPSHTKDKIASWSWGVIDEYIRDFGDGGIDVLYGMAKGIGLDNSCIVDEDPLTRMSKNLLEMRIERKQISA